MNKHASTTLPCPADKVAAPYYRRIKPVAAICRSLLNTLCISLLFCTASSSLYAMKQTYHENKTEITNEVKRSHYVINNMPTIHRHTTIYYTYKPTASVRTMASSSQWQFVYSRKFISLVDFDWLNAKLFGEKKDYLDFDAFFAVTTAPGYYLFRTVSKQATPISTPMSSNSTRLVPVYIEGIHEFTASQTHVLIPDNGYGQIDLDTDVEGKGEVVYQIENYAPGNVLIFSSGKQILIQQNGEFKIVSYGSGNLKMTVVSAKSGNVKIHADFGISKKSLSLSFAREYEPLLILKNANDSNNDYEADYKNRNPVTSDDPDLCRLDMLAAKIPDLSGPVQLTLKIPAAFNIYSSARKTAFIPASAVEGYHLVYHWLLTPENLNDIVQTLDTIYLEGVVPSAAPNDYEITLDITSPEGELVQSRQWKASIIDLFMNRSMLPAPYQSVSGFLVPRIKNPAVIYYVPPDSTPAQVADLSSLFEVQSSNMEMLEYFQDQIEWALYAEEGTNPVQFVPEGAMFGKSIKLQAVENGEVIIGVRLRGTNTDYLQITRQVASTKQIPVSFQFFTGNYTYTSRLQHEKFITSIPDILLCMNLIARQSGIVFTPVNPAHPGTRSSFLDKLSFTVEAEDNTLLFPEWISRQRLVLPLVKTKNKYTTGDAPHEWFYSILDSSFDTETGLSHVMKEPYFSPFQIQKNSVLLPPIKYPALIKPEIPDQIPLPYPSQKAVVYKDVPHWIIENAWPYTMAISSANNAVSFNFLPHGDLGDGKIGAITGLLTPSPLAFPIDTGKLHGSENTQHLVGLSYVNHFHIFSNLDLPGEPKRNHACAILPFPVYDDKERATFIPNHARKLIAAALRTLGLKERGLGGELDVYRNQELLNTALQQKTLLQREGRLIINPVTPLTAHESAVINPYDDILSLDPQQNHGYRIDESRTSLLREHPFTNP